MKAPFLSFILLLIFFHSFLHAEKPVKYGMKFSEGVSFASVTDETNLFSRSEFNPRVDVNFGVFAYWYRHHNFRFYSELEHQARGSKEKIQLVIEPDIPTNQYITRDNLFQYLSFSSGVQFTPFKGKFPMFINTSLSLNYLLRRASGFGELNFDIHRLVLGWEIGVGVVLAKLSPGKLFVAVSYEPDITNAVVNDKAVPTEIRIKHSLLSVSVGVMLP